MVCIARALHRMGLVCLALTSACTGSLGGSDEEPRSVAAPLAPGSIRELRPSGDPRGPANFGWAVASDGTRVLVGANRVGDVIGSEGAAYVFERPVGGGPWAQVARLRANEPPQAQQFGYSVALDGDLALIGSPYFDRASIANPGAAYVFERSVAGAWSQTARLDVPAQPNSYGGYAVALEGNRAFVGAWGYNQVLVFERSPLGSWTEMPKILAPDAVFGDRFGAALAIDAGRLVVGAPFAASEAGAVYLFESDAGGAWTLRQKLAGAAAGERFGRSVALSGSIAVVGHQGGARKLRRAIDGVWSVQAPVPVPPPGVGFDFGSGVATAGRQLLVGAHLEDLAPRRDNGAAYLYLTNPSGGFTTDRITAPILGSTDYFGYSVAMSGSLGVVGAYGDDDQAANGGAAYVLDLPQVPELCGPGSKCEPRNGLMPCGIYRLAASQTVTEEDDKIEVGWYDFGRSAKLTLPESLRLTSPAAGSVGFLYFHDDERRKDVRCRYSPPNAAATVWQLDGCKIPRAGLSNALSAGATIRASEVRFRLGGGDSLERGNRVAGDIDIAESGECNAFPMDDCAVARSTATRFSPTAERFENGRLPTPRPLVVPATIPILTPALAVAGQTAELALWNTSTRIALCTYTVPTAGSASLAFTSCREGAIGAGSVLTANRVVLRVLPKNFRKGPLVARVEIAPQTPSCVTTEDDDSDGIATLVELAASRSLGVADVDNDGLPNWRDADANGNGISDGVEGTVDVNANGVVDLYDVACEPSVYYADSDGDGFGDPSQSVTTCPAPAGYVENASDCDDQSDDISPDASEVCDDDLDNDCDAVVDEGCDPPGCMPAPIQGEGTILSQLQAGHGFTANAGGGSPHNLNDTADFVIGTQSAWVETDSAGTAKTLKRSNLGTFDFTYKMPRLWVKLDNVTSASTLQLYLGNNNLADQYKFTFNSTQGQQWTTEGDWVAFSMSWSSKHLSSVGSPNRAAITDVQLRAVDTATGTPVRVHANQFSMVDEPTIDYPNGVLSIGFDDGFDSVHTLGKPILDSYGFPATAYVIVDVLGTGNYMDVSDLTDLQNNSNWEIAYHSYAADVHTAGFPSTPTADLEQDIDLARDWLWDNGFTGYCNCAYPHGAFTGGATDVLTTVASRLSACRTVHQKHREAYPPSNPYKLRVLLVNKPVTVATVTAALDQAKANKEWIILVFHNLTDTPVINNDYDPDDLDAILAHASTIGIPVKTAGEVLALP